MIPYFRSACCDMDMIQFDYETEKGICPMCGDTQAKGEQKLPRSITNKLL